MLALVKQNAVLTYLQMLAMCKDYSIPLLMESLLQGHSKNSCPLAPAYGRAKEDSILVFGTAYPNFLKTF